MLIYKIFIFLWLALLGILVTENFVMSFKGYVFFSFLSNWFLVIASGIIWWFIWYGIFGFFSGKQNDMSDEENYDF